jgi:acyl-CoA dehydrogenase
MAKVWHTEMLGKLVDACLQLRRPWLYARVPGRAPTWTRMQRIYADTNEIMKVIIAKQMGL